MAQKRIEYYGKFTPTGVDTSQAKRLQALSGLAEQVGDIAFDIGAKIQTKRGQEAGIASGMEAAKDSESPEAPELREGFLSQISIYDQAYNEAALNAYSSGIRVDGRKKLMEFEEQFADEPDPEKFNDLWESYITGVTKGLPPEMAANLRLSLEDDGMRLGGKIADARRALDFDNNVATITQDLANYSDDLAQAVYEGDETLAETIRTKMENILADNVKFIDPIKAQEIRDELEDRLIVQSNLGQIKRFFQTKGSLEDQIETAQTFLRDMIAKPEIEGLNPEQKIKLEGMLGEEITRLSKALVVEDTEKARLASDFEVDVFEGKLTAQEVDERGAVLAENKVITWAKYTSLREQARTQQQKELESDQIARQFTNELRGNHNPMFAPSQAETDKVYEEKYAPQYADGTVQEQLNAGAFWIQKTGQVPTRLKKSVNSMITSGKPEEVIAAGVFIDQLDQLPGKFEAVVDTNNRIFAQQMIGLMDAGFEPTNAYVRAEQFLDPTNKERISVRREQIKKDYNKQLPKWTVDATGIQQEERGFADAQRQYSLLFESQYLAGASVDEAKDFANRVMNANFKDGEFGRMMFPPEDYYADSKGSVAYLRTDIAAEIRREIPGLAFQDENIFLISDETTQRTASENNPKYRVMIRDDNGELVVRAGYYEASEAYLKKRADEYIDGALLVAELRNPEKLTTVQQLRADLDRAGREDIRTIDTEAKRREISKELSQAALELSIDVGAEFVKPVVGLAEVVGDEIQYVRDKLAGRLPEQSDLIAQVEKDKAGE